MSFINNPVLNIIVVGFHHKKGCQVEHCYPELVAGRPSALPPAWRYLPALALPDGSHNYLSDTIFFHLPGLDEPAHTVYGISCFRQIPIEQVVQKTEDMTRSSVQKSVCIVCRAPLFGRLAVKLELVVRAWFLQGDFSQTDLLEDAFNHLNNCPVQLDQSLEGLSVTRLVELWRHKALLLVKLLLLRRRVLLSGAAAGPLSAAVLALVSLLPQTVPRGLATAANVTLSRPLSPVAKSNDEVQEAVEVTPEQTETDLNQSLDLLTAKETGNLFDEKDRVSRRSFDAAEASVGEGAAGEGGAAEGGAGEGGEPRRSPALARDMSVDGLHHLTRHVDEAKCGFPLALFSDGYVCLPYASLQHMDLLSDPAVAAFVAGASNVLFKQKRQLYDVLVDVDEARVTAADAALRRQLALGTEDLRFIDHVVRYAAQGDAWVRDQFASYVIYLLRTSLLPEGSRELEPFNAAYVAALRATPAHAAWARGAADPALLALPPGHPFAGQLSVADVKLKFAHTMSTTEGGRKVTAAVASTGRAVATTSRAVGGALSQARGALTGWWSSLTAPPPDAADDKLSSSDAEEAADFEGEGGARETHSPSPDPPDKTLEENTSNVGKIRVV